MHQNDQIGIILLISAIDCSVEINHENYGILTVNIQSYWYLDSDGFNFWTFVFFAVYWYSWTPLYSADIEVQQFLKLSFHNFYVFDIEYSNRMLYTYMDKINFISWENMLNLYCNCILLLLLLLLLLLMIWQSPGLPGWRKVILITVTHRPHHPSIAAGLYCLTTSPGFLPALCEKWSGFFYVHRVWLS